MAPPIMPRPGLLDDLKRRVELLETSGGAVLTSHDLWGQPFDGTGDVDGDITVHGGGSFTEDVISTDFVLEATGGGTPPPGVSAPIEVDDEGSILTAELSKLNLTGPGVTASATGGIVTVNVPHTWSTLVGLPTTFAGFGLTTELYSLGDARWLLLTGGSLSGALSVAGTLHTDSDLSADGTGDFGEDVTATDFVLGSGGTGTPDPGASAPIEVQEEGSSLTTELSVMNFTGASVTASAVGGVVTVSVVPTWSSITGLPTTIAGFGITDLDSLGDARWLKLTGGTMSGALIVADKIVAGINNGVGYRLKNSSGGEASFAIMTSDDHFLIDESGWGVKFAGAVTFLGSPSITPATGHGVLNIAPVTATNAAFTYLGTAGGNYYFGVENSAGSIFGASAYAMVLYTPAGLALQINKTTNAAAFGGALTAAGVGDFGGTANGLAVGSVAGRNRIQWNTDHFELVSSANVLTNLQANYVQASSYVRSTLASGWAIGAMSSVQRVSWGTGYSNFFSFLNASNGYAGVDALQFISHAQYQLRLDNDSGAAGYFLKYNNLTGSGTDQTPTFGAGTGLGFYWAGNNSTTVIMSLSTVGALTLASDLNCYDVHAVRAGATGVIYFGDQSGGSRYLYYDGSKYVFPNVYVAANDFVLS